MLYPCNLLENELDKTADKNNLSIYIVLLYASCQEEMGMLFEDRKPYNEVYYCTSEFVYDLVNTNIYLKEQVIFFY